MGSGKGVDVDERIRVFVVDDHDIVRAGVRQVLASDPDITVVGEAASAREALEAIVRLCPDVAIIDARLPDGEGMHVARDVRSAAPSVACVIFTAFTGEDAFLRSVMAGARGYLDKDADPEELVAAVRRVAAGESLVDATVLDELRSQRSPQAAFDALAEHLSPHEQRILSLVVDGWTNGEIAEELHLAEKTIRNYVSAILRKVGVRNRTQLAVYVAHLMDT